MESSLTAVSVGPRALAWGRMCQFRSTAAILLLSNRRSTARVPIYLNRNALDLIERDLIAGAVVELGGARAFMRGHSLGVFERAAGLEIGGDAGRAEHMAAELDLETGFGMRRRIMP
jgi:hypothetical protein